MELITKTFLGFLIVIIAEYAPQPYSNYSGPYITQVPGGLQNWEKPRMIRDLEQELERFKALLPRPFRRSHKFLKSCWSAC